MGSHSLQMCIRDRPNCEVAYPPVELKNVLGEYLSAHGKTQLRIAETEKYAHVTFFFNGGVEAPYEGEDRCVIPSPKVATYDLKPEMSAPEVAAECVKRLSLIHIWPMPPTPSSSASTSVRTTWPRKKPLPPRWKCVCKMCIRDRSVGVVVLNFSRLPYVLESIVAGAFNPAAFTGGTIGSLFVSMQKGVSRGIFSNEAGLGTGSIAHACACLLYTS